MHSSERDLHSDGGVRGVSDDRLRWEGPSGGRDYHGWAHQDHVRDKHLYMLAEGRGEEKGVKINGCYQLCSTVLLCVRCTYNFFSKASTSKTCISRTLRAIQMKRGWFIQEALLQL